MEPPPDFSRLRYGEGEQLIIEDPCPTCFMPSLATTRSRIFGYLLCSNPNCKVVAFEPENVEGPAKVIEVVQ